MGKAVVIEDATTTTSAGVAEVKDIDIDTFLLAHPSGVYEVARTLYSTHIVDFADHVARLANSLNTGKGIDTHALSIDVEGSLRAAWARTISLSMPLLFDPSSSQPPRELRLTALVIDAHARPVMRMATMAEVLPVVTGPVAVEVWRARRETPGVKDSDWVRARAHMKERTHTQPRVNEVVLQADDGTLHEGLSSNFFAVDAAGTGLLTAPAGTVLCGTVRSMVLDACKTLGVPVRHECPRECDGNVAWNAAFITSTTRMVLEVDEMRFIDTASHQPRRPPLNMSACPSPLIARIAAQVQQQLAAHSVKIL